MLQILWGIKMKPSESFPGVVACGECGNGPGHWLDKTGEHMSWVVLLVFDERAFVIQQMVWAASVLCYVDDRSYQGTGRVD